MNVFAEFVANGREVSSGEGGVHFCVEGFCDGGDGGGLEVCAGGDVEVAHVLATVGCVSRVPKHNERRMEEHTQRSP